MRAKPLLPLLILALFTVGFASAVTPSNAPQGYYPAVSSAVLNDPYANLTGYEDYLNAMYHGAVGGFPTRGGSSSAPSPSGASLHYPSGCSKTGYW